MTADPRACCVAGCPLPVSCGYEQACPLHCGGCYSWWIALRYWLRVWWRGLSWRGKQGGWYVWF